MWKAFPPDRRVKIMGGYEEIDWCPAQSNSYIGTFFVN